MDASRRGDDRRQEGVTQALSRVAHWERSLVFFVGIHLFFLEDVGTRGSESCSDGGGRTSLTECTRQHIPGTSPSRSHFLSCTVCGAVRFRCRASPCCSAMHLATHCLACCSVREDYTLGSGCSCAYQDPRLFRLVQSVYFITPVVAGVWIMGQVTEGGAWHQGAAGNFHSVVRQMPSSQLPGAP